MDTWSELYGFTGLMPEMDQPSRYEKEQSSALNTVVCKLHLMYYGSPFCFLKLDCRFIYFFSLGRAAHASPASPLL
jgi:hypothetical protein